MIVLLKQFLFKKRGKWQRLLYGLFTIGVSMIVAFVATGLLSWARLAVKLSSNPAATSSEWLANLHLISLGWWLLTVSLATLLFTFFKSEISNQKS